MKAIGAILGLAKAQISIMVTVTTATGYLLFKEGWDPELLIVTGGIFLAACGSAALNQVQEARIDARMERTRNRPIPSGRIDRLTAAFVGFLFIVLGVNLLAQLETNTGRVILIALLCAFWYNGVYTPLKRVTPFAVLPGALVGVLPPLAGWSAAGGVLYDPKIMGLAAFLGLWQIPHFWLLLVRHGKEYEKAGLPSPAARLGPDQVARITGVWLLATAVTGYFLTSLPTVTYPWTLGFLFPSIWLAGLGLGLALRRPKKEWSRAAFTRINLYALLILLLLAGTALV